MPNPGYKPGALQATVDAYIRNNFSTALTADDLGVSQRSVQRQLGQAKKEGIAVPEGEISHPPPIGYAIKGTSTLVGKDGEVTAQWVKTDRDMAAREEAMHAALEAMCKKIPRAKPIKPPKGVKEDRCNVYTITDFHMGMLAWHREGGANWDTNIAERVLKGCFADLIARSPKAHTCVIAQLGDFLHWDGLDAVTPTAGNVLDADGRFERVVQSSVRVLRHIVDLALQHHAHVHVKMCEGNHDLASSVWLRVMFASLYENDPRVTVDDSPLPYYCFQWGKTGLFWHHGHKRKLGDLPLLFAAQFPKIWGDTQYRFGHTGHFHSSEKLKFEAEKEHSGILMRQHQTLAARDAYAARAGYHAMRQATSITYSKTRGYRGEVATSPEDAEEAA